MKDEPIGSFVGPALVAGHEDVPSDGYTWPYTKSV